MGEFCQAYFQWILATDNVQCLFYCQKNQRITFKVSFVANRKLSVLITQNIWQQITFSAYYDPLNELNQQKLLFESNLPISATFQLPW
jgi:hypothetical protein